MVSAAREEVGWAERRVIDPNLSTSAREALAAAWLRTACDQHASVSAYAKIAVHLVTLGAPRELLEACHRAALDELDLARRSFSLASVYVGRAFGPGPIEALLRPERDARDPTALLHRLALETLEDGCLGEALGAELAREGLLHAFDEDVKLTLGAMAHIDAAHAELAWRILYWCCTAGDRALRAAVRAKLDELPRMIMPIRIDGRIAGELYRHGVVAPDRKRQLFIEVRQDLAARAVRILDGYDVRTMRFAPLSLVDA